jgi:hypothetical protein
LHRLWFEARCSRLKADLRYTSTTVFDSFPWPQAPTTAQVNSIEKIVDELLRVRAENLASGMSLARQYDTLRQPGKSRLRTLHTDLDAAVLSAYGFSQDDDLLTSSSHLTSTSQPNLSTPEVPDGRKRERHGGQEGGRAQLRETDRQRLSTPPSIACAV